jgi:serine/arginine repetitive matrix protein 1
MADAGFFKGTSAEQDSRFANKQKKLLKQMKFPDNIDVKVKEKVLFDNFHYVHCRLIC